MVLSKLLTIPTYGWKLRIGDNLDFSCPRTPALSTVLPMAFGSSLFDLKYLPTFAIPQVDEESKRPVVL